MGRKVNYDEKEKKGPGRKAKKQGDPLIPSKLKGKNAFEIWTPGHAFFILPLVLILQSPRIPQSCRTDKSSGLQSV